MGDKKEIRLKIDDEIHKKFKAICTMQGKTMSEVVEAFMSKYLEENKDIMK